MRLIMNFILVCTLTILVSSCAQQDTRPKTDHQIHDQSNETLARSLLVQAWKTTSLAESAKLRLDAANLLLEDQQTLQAKAVYLLINPRDLDVRYAEKFLITGLQIADLLDDTTTAELALQADSNTMFLKLPIQQKTRAITLKANALEKLDRHFEAAVTRIQNSSLFTGDQYNLNQERIWTNLALSDFAELTRSKESENATFEMAGWIALATAIKQNQYNLDEQLSALNRWQLEWPGHPATIRLPEELAILSSLPEKRPEQIVLALPLSGPLASAGSAVREGFMAAYYNDPFRNKNKTEISIVDTAKTEHFSDIYLEYSTHQPDLIIGPLAKEDVNELSTMTSLPVPVLALNYATTETLPPNNLYQFGLSHEDELKQVTDKVWSEGLRQIISVCPDTEWGWRMCELVRQGWEKNNGVLLESVFFNPKAEQTKLIESAFKVNESKQRARELNQILPERAELTPRRRQDIDAIILLSRPQNARQLKPLFAFYYAGDIPVFATSTLYDGKIDKAKDQDLNGIEFTDLPWILNRTNYLKSQLHAKQPELSKQYDRLFALGADAYLLAPRVSIFSKINSVTVSGNTGLLSMPENRRIQRTLEWATFSDGEAKPASGI